MAFSNPFKNTTRSAPPIGRIGALKIRAYRSRKLLDLAHRVHACQLMLPGVCTGYEAGGCEPAHANLGEAGKGGARKADDQFHVASCHACHVELDQGHRFTKAEKAEFWRQGHLRTLTIYFSEGWLRVAT